MATPAKNPSPVMTGDDVCELLRNHRATLYRLLKARTIPAFRIGSDGRFNREAIEQWLQVNERKSTR